MNHTTWATCPECGAPQVEGMTCWEQLGAILAWEWQDPELLAQHFLTVASYNLQHPAQYTEEALEGLWLGYVEHIDHGVSTETLLQRARSRFDGATPVRKKEAERTPVLRQWSRTIADVYLPDKPEGAADRVKQWAASIRAEYADK